MNVTDIFHFRLFFALLPPKHPKKLKLKKNPRYLIILHRCTKNYDQMMYGSWDMVCDGRTDTIQHFCNDLTDNGPIYWQTPALKANIRHIAWGTYTTTRQHLWIDSNQKLAKTIASYFEGIKIVKIILQKLKLIWSTYNNILFKHASQISQLT